jgi:hypothetical protein
MESTHTLYHVVDSVEAFPTLCFTLGCQRELNPRDGSLPVFYLGNKYSLWTVGLKRKFLFSHLKIYFRFRENILAKIYENNENFRENFRESFHENAKIFSFLPNITLFG